ncbi:MAG: ATP-dependent Clp protease adaptor ClpS [Myxococcota bacterium]
MAAPQTSASATSRRPASGEVDTRPWWLKLWHTFVAFFRVSHPPVFSPEVDIQLLLAHERRMKLHHARTTEAVFLQVLLEDQRFVAILTRRNTDVESLREDLKELVAGMSTVRDPPSDVRYDDVLPLILREAWVVAVHEGKREAGLAHVAQAFATRPESQAGGVMVARGYGQATRPRGRAPQAPRFDVVLHNDDVTTMDFVIRLLMEECGFSHVTAASLTLGVHSRGRAAVRSFPTEAEARELWERVQRSIAREGFPLVVTVEQWPRSEVH